MKKPPKAVEDWLKETGASVLSREAKQKGGSAKVPKGFAKMNPKRRSEVARKGGKVSKRGRPAGSKDGSVPRKGGRGAKRPAIKQ
jgi:hypothetical protein